jgi:hypothetical protein
MVYCRTSGILHEGISWIFTAEIERSFCTKKSHGSIAATERDSGMKNHRRIIIITLKEKIAVPRFVHGFCELTTIGCLQIRGTWVDMIRFPGS